MGDRKAEIVGCADEVDKISASFTEVSFSLSDEDLSRLSARPEDGKRSSIRLDDRHLMFIEPTATEVEEAVEDELTQRARQAWGERSETGVRWHGVHRCACGASSDNVEWIVRGRVTNSLLVHYVRDHRSEVPESELRKLREFGSERVT